MRDRRKRTRGNSFGSKRENKRLDNDDLLLRLGATPRERVIGIIQHIIYIYILVCLDDGIVYFLFICGKLRAHVLNITTDTRW